MRCNDVHNFFENIKNGDLYETTKQILSGYMSVNERDVFGNTALIMATMFNRVNIVRWLLENGADVNRANNMNKKPLEYAEEKGFTEVRDLILAEVKKHPQPALSMLEKVKRKQTKDTDKNRWSLGG